ncbi:MAG TPA: hypothetical protein PKY96_17565 [Flavobacteriales bacterium]|nr:hypothetical protein [Flavobacteriales bacterium]
MNAIEPLAFPPLAATGPLTYDTVQREWACTLGRLRELCEVLEAPEHVSRSGYARLFIKRHDGLELEAIERILFDNLLLAMYTRTEDDHKIYFGGEWLWHWRRAVPWRAEKVGHINRLVPWQPQHQWSYRFNLIEAEM